VDQHGSAILDDLSSALAPADAAASLAPLSRGEVASTAAVTLIPACHPAITRAFFGEIVGGGLKPGMACPSACTIKPFGLGGPQTEFRV
jgi:hypothetical protein